LAPGFWEGVPVFGLPGNPVAALICKLARFQFNCGTGVFIFCCPEEIEAYVMTDEARQHQGIGAGKVFDAHGRTNQSSSQYVDCEDREIHTNTVMRRNLTFATITVKQTVSTMRKGLLWHSLA